MANTLKIKRGAAASIPQGQLAEPLFTSDTYDLYIGKGGALGNQRFQKYIASGTSSQFLKGDGSLDSNTYQTALTFSSPLVNTSGTVTINQSSGSADGYLSSTDWTTFNSKEPAITAGTTLQYYRGDKTFQTLDTSVVPENGPIYFTEPRVRATVLTGLNLSGGGTIAATDSVLTAFGKVQNQISALVGGATYQGTWNASTNSPALASGTGTKGYYYVVSVAGSTNLDGITDWKIGDWAIFNGTTWDKVDNTDAVSSVNGFTGAVNLALDNISDVSAASPTNAQLLRFNGTSSLWENWTPTYISGNQTITLSGDVSGSGETAITTTIGALKVTNAMLAGSIAASKLVGTDIATVGTITAGTWNGTTIAVANGGTGATSFTAGQILYGNGTSAISSESNLFWDATNDRLGIGTNAPLYKLQVTNVGGVPSTSSVASIENDGASFQINITSAATGTALIDLLARSGGGGNVSTAGFTFSTRNAATISEKMRITSGGNVGIGTTSLTGYNLRVAKTITGATNSYGVTSEGVVQSDVTSTANYFLSVASTQATAFTLSSFFHYRAQQGTIGASSTVTNQFGFAIDDTLIGATNNYGFRGAIPSGSGRWNIYMDGTANNYMAGALGIGTTTLTGINLNVNKNNTGATTTYNIISQGNILSDVTASAHYFTSSATVQNTAFTLTNLYHYRATGASSFGSATVTNQYGFIVDNVLTGATNNYGFYGNIASGTGRWNIYMNGTAANYMAGKLLIGSTTDSGEQLQVTGTAKVTGAATFSSSVTAGGIVYLKNGVGGGGGIQQPYSSASADSRTWWLSNDVNQYGDFAIQRSTTQTGTTFTTAIEITKDGNVGIGLASVNYKLDVANNGAASFFGITNQSGASGDRYLRIGFGSGATFASIQGTRINVADDVNLALQPDGGNVGIGVTSPSASDWNASAKLLHIYQNSTNGSILKLESSNAAGVVAVGNNQMQIATTTDDPMIFYTNSAERMRITSGGNVGIGVSPSYRLDVSSGASGVVLNLEGTNAYNAETGILMSSGRAKISGFLESSGGTPGSILRFYTMPNGGSVTERMTITSGGEVLINTTTDSGAYYLQVNGSVYATAYYESSDIRLKDVLTNSYSENFSAIEFMWKDKRDEKKHWGYAAQDVMKYIPDAIEVNNDGMMTVNYNEAHTWKIAQLEAKILELESKLK
jgi:hypothetical protein